MFKYNRCLTMCVIKVAKVGDVRTKLCVSAKDKSLALFRIKGEYYCIDNYCPHLYGPLCEGQRNGFVVTCPWHGSKFDVRDGSLKAPPARVGVKTHKVTVKEGSIFVHV